jgi:hypothetical protein
MKFSAGWEGRNLINGKSHPVPRPSSEAPHKTDSGAGVSPARIGEVDESLALERSKKNCSRQEAQRARRGGDAIQKQPPKRKGRGMNGKGIEYRLSGFIPLPLIPLPISVRLVLPNPGAP